MKTTVLLFLFVFSFSVYAEPIHHIEWAAANYAGLHQGNPELQFTALKNSLDEVLASHEPKGILYINDLDVIGMSRAIHFAGEYLTSKGIHVTYEQSVYEGAPVKSPEDGVLIVGYPGDIFLLPIPQTSTATLRNPEPVMVLLRLLTSEKSRLTDLANSSRSGLNIVTYLPLVEQQPENDWIAKLEALRPTLLPLSPDETYWDFQSKADGHWMFYMKYRRYNLPSCDGQLR